MGKKTDPIIHFEMPAEDTNRVRAFYESAFGWQTHALGPEAGGFVMAFTTESDPETRIPLKPGAINGGFYIKGGPADGVKLTILVDDIEEAVRNVEDAGGIVLGEPFELPGVGLFVDIEDPEGNVVTLNQDFTVKHL
jgi:uncharacterized protein